MSAFSQSVLFFFLEVPLIQNNARKVWIPRIFFYIWRTVLYMRVGQMGIRRRESLMTISCSLDGNVTDNFPRLATFSFLSLDFTCSIYSYSTFYTFFFSKKSSYAMQPIRYHMVFKSWWFICGSSWLKIKQSCFEFHFVSKWWLPGRVTPFPLSLYNHFFIVEIFFFN